MSKCIGTKSVSSRWVVCQTQIVLKVFLNVISSLVQIVEREKNAQRRASEDAREAIIVNTPT